MTTGRQQVFIPYVIKRPLSCVNGVGRTLELQSPYRTDGWNHGVDYLSLVRLNSMTSCRGCSRAEEQKTLRENVTVL